MNDEINYSTQISSKKITCSEWNNKIFASGRLEAAVTYGCNPSVNTIFAAAKTRGSVPSNGEPFLVVVFYFLKLQDYNT